MSFVRFSNGEGTASGTTVSAANSGGTSGYAFSSVTGTTTFDNAQFFTGAQSYKIASPGAAAHLNWLVPGTPTTVYTRQYIYLSALPSRDDAAGQRERRVSPTMWRS